MSRFVANLIASILAFIAGIVTASSWSSKTVTVITKPPVVVERCPPGQSKSAISTASVTMDPYVPEFFFGKGLKLVAERIKLKSQTLHYDIDVTYPQITGSKDAQIGKINQHIKDRVTEQFQWALKPSPAVLKHEQQEVYNTVNLTYGNGLATDSYLSIQIVGYSVEIDTRQTDNHRLVMNFDLTSGKQLYLSDIFKPGSDYLDFISRYCLDELIKRGGVVPVGDVLRAMNFDDWNITSNGINFNFDGCKISNCTRHDESVEIPFADLEQLLRPGVPGKFKITYP